MFKHIYRMLQFTFSLFLFESNHLLQFCPFQTRAVSCLQSFLVWVVRYHQLVQFSFLLQLLILVVDESLRVLGESALASTFSTSSDHLLTCSSSVRNWPSSLFSASQISSFFALLALPRVTLKILTFTSNSFNFASLANLVQSEVPLRGEL